MDRWLDEARGGPTFLRYSAVAQLVPDSLQYGAEIRHYGMHSRVLMPNHVHLLLTPHVSLSRFLGSLKAATARHANVLLKRTGRPFRQHESYDRAVRNANEFRRIQKYIENNPVTAGLATTPEQYVWSSAGRTERPPQAEDLPPDLSDERLIVQTPAHTSRELPHQTLPPDSKAEALCKLKLCTTAAALQAAPDLFET